MAREQRVHDARHDSLLVAEDSGNNLRRLAERGEQVLADLVLDAAWTVPGGLELSEGLGTTHAWLLVWELPGWRRVRRITPGGHGGKPRF